MAASSSSAMDTSTFPAPGMMFNIPVFVRMSNTVYRRVKDNFTIPPVLPCLGPPKSTEQARQYRLEARQYMMDTPYGEVRNKKLRQALEIYSRSIALAPKDSQELAEAYANRSGVFYELCQHVLSLVDVNRALMNHNLPPSLREQMNERKNRCKVQIQIRRATYSMRERIQGDETDPIDDDTEKPSLLWADKFDHPKFPNTSSKIELRNDETWGRHMVASQDIEAGEILSCEEFFSFGLPPDGHYRIDVKTKKTAQTSWKESIAGRYDHCSHCGKKCKALIPCHSCSVFMFCSEKCRLAAYDSYHRTECKMGILYWDGRKLRTMYYFLALRTLLVGTEQGAKLGELMETLPFENIFGKVLDQVNEPFTNDYKALLSLSKTYDQKLIKQRMVHAIEVVIVLRSVGFFKGVPNNFQYGEQGRTCLNDAELYVTALLLNHYNTEKLYEFVEPKNVSMEQGAVRPSGPFMLGTFVLHPLINHACDANADVFVRKREHVLYAKRPIEKGKQIFISYYGEPYKKPVKSGLQGVLQLPFTCQCDACIHNWPSCDKLALEHTSNIVSGTDRQVIIDTLRQMTIPIMEQQHREIPLSEFREIVIRIITFLHKHLERPAFPLVLFEQYLSLYTRIQFDEITQKDDKIAEISEIHLGNRDPCAGEQEIERYSAFVSYKLFLIARKSLQELRDRGFHLLNC